MPASSAWPAPKLMKILSRGKLTKKFLFSLTEGLYIASGCIKAPGQSIFADVVAPASERPTQWQSIVAAGADNRLCLIFEAESNYVNWLSFQDMPDRLWSMRWRVGLLITPSLIRAFPSRWRVMFDERCMSAITQ